MTCKIRKWELADAKDLAATISNPKVQDNLRDGLPYPYTERDGMDFISAMLAADETRATSIAVRRSWGTTSGRNTGVRAL